MQSDKRVIVIGAGAAGMLAAGTAGEMGYDVTLLEKNKRPGRKLMLTGKGRCNITNDTDVKGLIAGVPVNGKFLYSAFNSFSSQDLIRLLNELGLDITVERGGRVFPASGKSSDVVDVLQRYIKKSGVEVVHGKAEKIALVGDSAAGVFLESGRKIDADSVIIATGGMSYPATGSTGDGYRLAEECGHNIIPLKPSLVPLEIKEEWVKDLQGLSLCNIAINVYTGENSVIYKDFGEMLFTHFGVSGPVILSASSFMRGMSKERYRIAIDLKPALTHEQLDRRIQRDFSKYSRKIFANSLGDLLPKTMIPVIVKLSGIPGDKPVNQIRKEEREALANLLKTLTVNVRGFRPIEEAIITSGGVDVREVNPSTMESKIIRGLFFAGEVLDVDGYTGGYNLQIAFSTGHVAARNS